MPHQQSPVRASVVVASAIGYCILAVATVVLTYTFLTRTTDKRGRARGGPDVPPGPVILVEATFPGAGPPEVAQAVANPLEKQLKNIVGLRYLLSRCEDDGGYALAVTFERDVPGDKALAAIREGVQLVRANLAEPFRRRELTVKEKPAGMQLLVLVSAPDGTQPDRVLGDYARRDVKEKLSRLADVAEVALFGAGEECVAVHLDEAKLTAHRLTIADVGRIVREQHGRVVPGGQGSFCVLGTPPHRLPDPEKFGAVLLKADAERRVVYLKDVAAVKGATHSTGSAAFNGKRVVGLGIYPSREARPGDLSSAVKRTVAELQATCPNGVRVEVAFDFAADGPAAPACLLLEVLLPNAVGPGRREERLRRCAGLVRPFAGEVLELSDPPFPAAARRPNQGYLLVRLAPENAGPAGRERAGQAIRKQLAAELPAAVVRLLVVAGEEGGPQWHYPLTLAVSGPDSTEVQTLAEDLVAHLARNDRLTDVFATRGQPPVETFEVDAEAARAHGVALQDVHDALAVETVMRATAEVGTSKIPDGKGQRIPLRLLLRRRDPTVQAGPLRRFDGRPMARVTANPAPGVGLDEARRLCEERFEAARKERRLAEEYRFSWLDE